MLKLRNRISEYMHKQLMLSLGKRFQPFRTELGLVSFLVDHHSTQASIHKARYNVFYIFYFIIQMRTVWTLFQLTSNITSFYVHQCEIFLLGLLLRSGRHPYIDRSSRNSKTTDRRFGRDSNVHQTSIPNNSNPPNFDDDDKKGSNFSASHSRFREPEEMNPKVRR